MSIRALLVRAFSVRRWLYRNQLSAVILGAALFAGLAGVPDSYGQYGRKPVSAGPRALGLVRITSGGKARLTPICILMDGKFFDAGSYKASPVPMALDFGVVYEGSRTGVSQGLFTITQPGQLNHNWIAEGTWLPEGMKPKETTKKYAQPVIEDKSDERPVLHRRAEGAPDKKDESKPAASDSKASTSAGASKDSTKDAAKGAEKDAKDMSKTAQGPRKSDLDTPINDPNRPILRRGKPDPNSHREPYVTFEDEALAAKTSKEPGRTSGESAVQVFPAISDAGGPDIRPYNYDLKQSELDDYRRRMLDMAAKLVQTSAGAAAAAGETKPAAVRSSKAVASKPKPATKTAFEDVSLRIFDLSNSNEPVLVLSARTSLPPVSAAGSQVPQEITLVARTNLENELQKLFFAQTDSRHLDVQPRMELIDAVDADGDGRGELLFRQTGDAGSAYAIYRVAADRLWLLYAGTPQ